MKDIPYFPYKAGGLPTLNQDQYFEQPGLELSEWWVQVWECDENGKGINIVARAYGPTPELAADYANRIARGLKLALDEALDKATAEDGEAARRALAAALSRGEP